jgi:hypothetical protein
MYYLDTPITVYWRTMQMDLEWTASAYFEKIVDFAKKDGIWDALRNNLVR